MGTQSYALEIDVDISRCMHERTKEQQPLPGLDWLLRNQSMDTEKVSTFLECPFAVRIIFSTAQLYTQKRLGTVKTPSRLSALANCKCSRIIKTEMQSAKQDGQSRMGWRGANLEAIEEVI